MADSLATKISDAADIPAVPASMLSAPEDAYIPVTSQGMGSDLDNVSSSIKSNIQKLFPQIEKAEKDKANAAKTQAVGETQAIQAYRDQLSTLMKDYKPQQVDTDAQPKLPEVNPMKQFGSLASMLGIFASAFTKRPMVNALNASAAAMNAQRSNNQEAYKEAYQQWKDNTELALQKHKVEMENINEILNLSKEDNAAAMAQLKAYGVAQSSDAASVLSQLGDWEEIGKWYHSMQAAGQKLTNLSGELFNEEVQKFVQENGRPPSVEEKIQMKKKAEGKDTSNVLSDDEYKKLKDLPEVISAAEAMHSGFTASQAMPGLSAKNSERQAAQRLYAEKYPKENVAEAHLKYLMQVKEVQGVGALSGRLKFASNLLDQSLPSMMAAAEKLGLSPSTDINTLYNVAKKHFSDKEFSNFRTQLRAVASDYAQFIGRGSGTVHSDEEALRIINENMGEGGLQGFVDGVETEKINVDKAIKISENQVGGGGKETVSPVATHKYNPATGELEEIK